MGKRFGANLTRSYAHAQPREEKIFFPGSRLTEGAEFVVEKVKKGELGESKYNIAAGAHDYAYMENCDRSFAHCPNCKLALSSASQRTKICGHCDYNFRKTGPIMMTRKPRK